MTKHTCAVSGIEFQTKDGWIEIKEVDLVDIRINENVLITDGYEVFSGFLDSHHTWCMHDQTPCDECDFDITHFMYYPNPPIPTEVTK